MELTEKQQQGLQIAIDRYLAGERYTVISGYAGTGKSTLVSFIINALKQYGINPDTDVIFTSFTGKATQVLARKGNKNTLTLHKLLYESHPKGDGTFFRKPVLSIPYKIAVVDEISMVPMTLMKQLASHQNVYCICLGDPGQLPPIYDNENNHLLDNPHVFLDEIMRQAAESEIIQLTMKIRNGEKIIPFKGKEVQVIKRSELTTGMLQWADQILCATNETRRTINNQMRALCGRSGEPKDGDKVICDRNYWEDECKGGSALVNGTVGYIHNCYSTLLKLPYGPKKMMPLLNCNFTSDIGEDYGKFPMDKTLMMSGEQFLDTKTEYRLSQNPRQKWMIPYAFEYGYAITVHRAQGSEWDNVLVIEERFPFSKEEHKRWLYTALTRASKKIVWVLPE